MNESFPKSQIKKNATKIISYKKLIFNILSFVSLCICNQTLPGASHSKRSFEITTENLPASLDLEEFYFEKSF